MSIPADLAPDFGLALLNRGVPHDKPLDFPFFEMTEVSVLGPGRYSTTVQMPVGEVGHALTLDFGVEIRQEILALAPPRVRRVVGRRLTEDPATPRRIEFGEPMSLGISTVLGELQATARETFLPLLIRRVYPSSLERGDVESEFFGPTKPAPRPRKPAGRGGSRSSPKKGRR